MRNHRAARLSSALLSVALLVSVALVSPAGAVPTTVLSQDFTSETFPPAGWTEFNGPKWTREASCAEFATPSSCAAVTGPGGDFGFATPRIDVSALTSPKIDFDLFISDPVGTGRLILRYSNDCVGIDGLADGTIHAPDPLDPSAPDATGLSHRSLDIPAQADPYCLRFVFSDSSVAGEVPATVKIDNIVVSGDGAAPAPNTPPIAPAAARFSVVEDQPQTLTFSGETAVRDPDGDQLTYVQTTDPDHGTISDVEFLPSGMSLRYTPDPNFDGIRNTAGDVYAGDDFKFKVNDGEADSPETTVTIDMTAVNDAPVVEGPNSIDLLQDQERFTFSNGNSPGGCHDPGCAATPDVPLGASDDAPAYATGYGLRMIIETTTAAGGRFSLGQTTGLTFSEGDGTADQRMAFTGSWPAIDAALSAGTAYQPAPGFVGSDTLRLFLDDQGHVGLGGAKSHEKFIAINVGGVNHRPTAEDKAPTVSEDGSVAVTLTGADVDGDALTFDVATQPMHGTLTGTVPNLTYTPAANYVGTDSFTYTANDGELSSHPATVSITVAGTTDPPVITDLTFTTIEDYPVTTITLSASNPDNVPITWEVGPASSGALFANGVAVGSGVTALTSPTLTYTPNRDFNGLDSFVFRARATIDGAPYVSGFKQATIDVESVNDAPVAGDQVLKLKTGETKPLILEATDVDGDPLTFTLLRQPQVGTLTGTAPNLTYAAPSSAGGAYFAYTVSDGQRSDTGSVAIEISDNQPDVTIGLPGERKLGYEVFNGDAAGQTLATDAPPGTPTDIEVDIRNTGSFADRYLVTGSLPPQGWSVRYLVGGQDISQEVKDGKEFALAAGSVVSMTMRVTPPEYQAGGTFVAFVVARSLAVDGGSDTVAANIRGGTFKPDLLVRERGRADAVGDDIYNATGASQTIIQRGASGRTVYSHFYVQNDGTAPDDFLLKGDIGPGIKWLRQIGSDTEITSSVEAGTYTIRGLLPGEMADILLVYEIPEDTAGWKSFQMTATSVANGTSDTAISKIETFGAGQPDLILGSDQVSRSLPGRSQGGADGVYNGDGAGQSSYEFLTVGGSNVYSIDFENDSSVETLFGIRTDVRACFNIDCSGSPGEHGMEVRFWELNPREFSVAEGNRDITASVISGQEIEGSAQDLVDRYWLEVTSQSATPVDVNLRLSLTARAVGNPAKEDRVFVDLRTVEFRPDVTLLATYPAAGENVYNEDAANPRFEVNLGSSESKTVGFRVENDPLGNTLDFHDRILVTATPESKGFNVRYLDPTGADITSDITSGGYLLTMGALKAATFKAVVTTPSKSRAGVALPLRFTATSLTSSLTNHGTVGAQGPVDVAGYDVRVAYRPDVAVALDEGPLQPTRTIGDGDYDPLVGSQELVADARMLNSKRYTVKLSNDGPLPDTLKASLDGNADGFAVKVFDGTTDVTSAIRGGSYTTSLPAGATKDLSVTVRPGGRTPVGSKLSLTFTASSQTRPLSELDAARIVTTSVITCDETAARVGVVDIEGACLMKTDSGYLSQEPLVLNGVELTMWGPPAIIDTARQQLTVDQAEMRFADLAIDTVVRIPVTLDSVVKTRCDEFLYLDDWHNGASTCSINGATIAGRPLGLSAGDWQLSGTVDHLGQAPWGWVFGEPLPADDNPSWQYGLTWLPDGGVKVDVPVPAPDAFNGAPAELPLTLGVAPPRYVEVGFDQLKIEGIPLFGFVDSKLRHYLDTGERLLYGRVGLPGVPLGPASAGFQYGAKFEGSGMPEWIFAKLKTGFTEESFPILPPHVYLDSATFVIEPQGPAVIGTAEADVWKMLSTGGTGSGMPGFLMSMKASMAYEQEKVSARGEMYLLGVIGPLADAKVTAGSAGIRASMNWNYSVGIGEIDFGELGTLDLGRLGIDAALDGSGSGDGFEVSGTGQFHVFDSNVGLNAVISSIGAAGCATAKISSLGSGDVGLGVKWDDGGSPAVEYLSNCSLSDYKDPTAPQHVDFAGFTTRFKSYLAEADNVEALMQSLPQAVSMLGL